MAQPKCKFVFPVLLKSGVFYLPGANNVHVMAPSDLQRGRWGSETRYILNIEIQPDALTDVQISFWQRLMQRKIDLRTAETVSVL